MFGDHCDRDLRMERLIQQSLREDEAERERLNFIMGVLNAFCHIGKSTSFIKLDSPAVMLSESL